MSHSTAVFDFDDYKDFLRRRIAEGGRGYQAAVARAAGGKSSYLSQVPSGPVHLTPDHVANLCAFWKFSELESDYLLAMVGLARAATPTLKRSLHRQMDSL